MAKKSWKKLQQDSTFFVVCCRPMCIIESISANNRKLTSWQNLKLHCLQYTIHSSSHSSHFTAMLACSCILVKDPKIGDKLMPLEASTQTFSTRIANSSRSDLRCVVISAYITMPKYIDVDAKIAWEKFLNEPSATAWSKLV
jgi:hypothetical protein